MGGIKLDSIILMVHDLWGWFYISTPLGFEGVLSSTPETQTLPRKSKTIPENITKDIQEIQVAMVMILMARQWPGSTTDQFHPVAIW